MAILAEITKSAPEQLMKSSSPGINELMDMISTVPSLSASPIVRKLRSKCIARSASRLLPTTYISRRRFGKTLHACSRSLSLIPATGKALLVTSNAPPEGQDLSVEVNVDVPDEVEGALGQLFELLVDRVSGMPMTYPLLGSLADPRIPLYDGLLRKGYRALRIDYRQVSLNKS